MGPGAQPDPDRSEEGTSIRGDAADGPEPGATLPVRVTLPGEGGASGLHVEAVEGGPVHPSRNLVGRRVGPYLVTRYIQHGGMGEVWEAVQESPRRPVALKLMRGGLSDQGARRRFTDEAEIIARLRHPNIAHVYGAGYFEDPDTGQPEPYFAMLFVPGARSLTRYAFDEGLGSEARLRLFADVCDALAHAHAEGVVHRDLKPSNVLVGEDGRPYVIDFGIAQAAAHVLPRARRTESGQVIGTPAYLSPEQTLGDPGAVDHRADVYALGVILYELICGRHPLNLERFDTPETLQAVRRGDIIDPGTLVPDLDADLRGIMRWALARRREDRPPSAGALREEIVRYLECRPRADGHLTWAARGCSAAVAAARRSPVGVRLWLLLAVVLIMQFPVVMPWPGLSAIQLWFDAAIPRLAPRAGAGDGGLQSVRYVSYSPGDDLAALALAARVPVDHPGELTSWRLLHARALERLAQAGARVVVLTPNYVSDRHADALARSIRAAQDRGVPVWVRQPGDWRPGGAPISPAEFSPTLWRVVRTAPMVRGLGDGRVWSELALQPPDEDALPSIALGAYCSLRQRTAVPEVEVIDGVNLLRVRYREAAGASPGSRARVLSTEEIRVSNVIRRAAGQSGPEGLVAIQQVFVPPVGVLRAGTLTLSQVLTAPMAELRRHVAGRAVFLGDPWTLPPDQREALATPDGDRISPEWVEPLVLEQMLSPDELIRWPTFWEVIASMGLAGLIGCGAGLGVRREWAVGVVVICAALLLMSGSLLVYRQTGMVYNPVIPVLVLAVCAGVSAWLPSKRFPLPRPLPGVRVSQVGRVRGAGD